MIDFEISSEPGCNHSENELRELAEKKTGYPKNDIHSVILVKRSLDARKKPVYRERYRVLLNGESFKPENNPIFTSKRDVTKASPVIVAGSGPAGLFAALSLVQNNLKPVIIERGKEVRERRFDLAKLMKQGLLNPESNYCFGEGGAGTFSDGKLYTRSHKRGKVYDILNTLVFFGAHPAITVDAHPHIGTNKLPEIIENIRKHLLESGAKFHFNTRLEGFSIKNGVFSSAYTNKGVIDARALILATGHSAGDVYRLLHSDGIELQPKGFAIGVRIEHPQEIINKIQYRSFCGNPALPPASYQLVTQASKRGVYSFCMCPGGIICPASTEENHLVVNGWSPSRRNSPFANSGIVVEIPENCIPGSRNYPLAGLDYQGKIEEKAFQAGGGKFRAPAQRLNDFLKSKISSNLPQTSYKPGTTEGDMREILPKEIHERLKEGLSHFVKNSPLYGSTDAVLVGVESRTSSPVRIPRNDSGMHPGLKGLFPAGEGAGYAGGIISAALDGIKIGDAVSRYLINEHYDPKA
ncbi:MAG TPA: FAD-binding protein [Oligoflexia bacterium]|nr:FAD-binding protein [Oligoflexia bacterium]HMP48424.1 FAD-binding protein [Oligoflexia bacterium]